MYFIELCGFQALGGRVESKVPRAGYVLVQPGTSEEERLRLCWASPDRPERYFVPYTYVEACKIHGMLLKQIFVHDGQPIRMHIDSSIANVNVRATLSTRIMVSPSITHWFISWLGEYAQREFDQCHLQCPRWQHVSLRFTVLERIYLLTIHLP